MDKSLFRKVIAERKSKLTTNDRIDGSKKIFERLVSLDVIQKSESIAAFYPLPQEIDITPFLDWVLKHGKKLFLPTFFDGNYFFIPIDDLSTLELGPFGVKQPPFTLSEEFKLKVQCIIVPGVAFDLKGNRLGWGKGIYDRLLTNYPSTKIGVGFECQKVESLPSDPWDILMDAVVFG